jgi:hypothetical protein
VSLTHTTLFIHRRRTHTRAHTHAHFQVQEVQGVVRSVRRNLQRVGQLVSHWRAAPLFARTAPMPLTIASFARAQASRRSCCGRVCQLLLCLRFNLTLVESWGCSTVAHVSDLGRMYAPLPKVAYWLMCESVASSCRASWQQCILAPVAGHLLAHDSHAHKSIGKCSRQHCGAHAHHNR